MTPQGLSGVFCVLLLAFSVRSAQLDAASAGKFVHDPGPRPGAAAAGGPIATISVYEKQFYLAGRSSFEDEVSVTGSLPGTEKGLGPRFNLDSCAGCHTFPALGGSSPAKNPQIEVAAKQSAKNRIPWFVNPNGPIRVARFKFHSDGTPDGSVHPLFTIAGRSDAPQTSCKIDQPDFGAQKNNIGLRIPTPLFGLGLIEAIPDQELLDNLAAHAAQKRIFKIGGRVSRSANDASINRFGWKAQNRS
ncbi:MAG TPA: di-heme oxidoredictase family protein, partial [Bryobacteraceae bacterium]